MWKALIDAVVAGKTVDLRLHASSSVSEGSPRRSTLWHNGKTVVTDRASTPASRRAPTATGTYPVYEHLRVTTMSGTNPDGSHYNDPGIPWVSYFNGGDALHGFTARSLRLPAEPRLRRDAARRRPAQVYPYTPIGTLVDVD